MHVHVEEWPFDGACFHSATCSEKDTSFYVNKYCYGAPEGGRCLTCTEILCLVGDGAHVQFVAQLEDVQN